MLGFDYDAHAERAYRLLHGFGDLDRHTLLHLQATGEHVCYPCKLGEADDLTIRNVGDVRVPEKGEQVMFAHREELDVATDDHIVRVRLEDGSVNDRLQIRLVATRDEAHRFRRAIG